MTTVPNPPHAGLNIHLYQSPIEYESRMLKITKTLAEHGVFHPILLVGKWRPGLALDEPLDEDRSILRLRTTVSPTSRRTIVRILQTLEWMWRALWLCLRLRPTCLNCHSLMVLPIGVFVKWWTRCELIYDTHELETETSQSRGVRRWVSKLTERCLIRRADKVLVVGHAIADWYERTYPGLKAHVVRNVPYARTPPAEVTRPFHDKFAIPEGDMVFLYQGLIDHGRGIDVLLKAFADAPASRHVVFLGYGPLVDDVLRAGEQHANIHYHPAVRPEELFRYSRGADVGLSVIENLCLSYAYCVPNKLFEYLNAGVPVIVSDLPEMGRVIDSSGCGWKVAIDAAALRNLITEITPEDVAAKRTRALRCRGEYCWESESQQLLEIYGVTPRVARCA